MIRAPRLRGGALGLAALGLAPLGWLANMAGALGPEAAAAHQQKRAISTIAANPRSAKLEIMHQIPVHDAEHALRILGAPSPDVVGSEESRRAFAAYVAARFALEVDGAPLTLAFVGSQIEAGSLWVYQEAALPLPGAAIAVNSQILTDIWAEQENRVNLGARTKVRTLVFRGGDGAKAAGLPDPEEGPSRRPAPG